MSGDFFSAPFLGDSKGYKFDNTVDNKDSWFYKVFRSDDLMEQNRMSRVALSSILNVEPEKVEEVIGAYKNGHFPVELSSDSKAEFFDLLAKTDLNLDNYLVDKEAEERTVHQTR